jgi:pre-mRNA-processing factor 19
MGKAYVSEENATDPISGEALTKEDLIDVKASKYNNNKNQNTIWPVEPNTLPPRLANQTSIPALLTSLQAEYDSIMLESLEIKKAFQSSRQELANALYREDAATRVIARLMKERDESRDALASIQQTVGFAPAAEAEDEGERNVEGGDEDVEMRPEGSLPVEVEFVITETNQE